MSARGALRGQATVGPVTGASVRGGRTGSGVRGGAVSGSSHARRGQHISQPRAPSGPRRAGLGLQTSAQTYATAQASDAADPLAVTLASGHATD